VAGWPARPGRAPGEAMMHRCAAPPLPTLAGVVATELPPAGRSAPAGSGAGAGPPEKYAASLRSV
jgi:hypothetical protein